METVSFRSCQRCEAAFACGTMLLPMLGGGNLESGATVPCVVVRALALRWLLLAASRCFPLLPVASRYFPLLPATFPAPGLRRLRAEAPALSP